MNYLIKELPGMFTVAAEGSEREEAKAKLSAHLEDLGIPPKRYFFFEMFRQGKAVGSMAIAEVETKPDSSRKFRSGEVKAAPYFLLELTYQEYVNYDDGEVEGHIDIKKYVKEQGYKIADFPLYELAPELGEDMIRVYVRLQ